MLLAAVLFAGTFILYQPVLKNGFVNFDDNTYITQNQHVQQGLTREGIKWAFTSFDESNWHPLTWISHMLDVGLFGLNPTGHHFVNLWWHCINVVLLFSVLWGATGAMGRSFWVAAIFAVHPLNVETVAWVAERKSLLSTAFALAAIAGYGYYIRRRNWKRYAAIVVPFTISLLSKPMFVTLPFTLLIIDYWPLNRIRIRGNGASVTAKRLLWEKSPLIALSLASCVITLKAQRAAIAMGGATALSKNVRMANALRSYGMYVEKFFWPTKLSVFYPLNRIGAGQLIAGAVFLLAASLLVWRLRAKRYLVAGWVWYLFMLVPVIGIVQVGRQAMADRYMYVPMIGLLVMVVWGCSDLAQRLHLQHAAVAIAGIIVMLMGPVTVRQISYWRDSINLFSHAIAVTQHNYLAYNSLAGDLDLAGRSDEALEDFEQSWAENPSYGIAAFNIGVQMERRNQPAEAIQWYKRALGVLSPWEGLTAATYTNLGAASEKLGDLRQAEAYYRQGLRINSEGYQPNLGLAGVLSTAGKYDEAIQHLATAWKVHHNGVVDLYLGRALEGKHDTKQALWAYQHALMHLGDLSPEQQSEAQQRIALLENEVRAPASLRHRH